MQLSDVTMRMSQRLLLALLVLFTAVIAWGAPGALGAEGASPLAGGSPFSDYTASVLIYGLLVALLVITLLAGGFLVLNLGLLSKRGEDRIGGRNPSDVGVLKNTIWPQEPFDEVVLPAEETAEEVARAQAVRDAKGRAA